MIPVVLESPYAGDVKTHTEYAKRAMRDSLERGEAPIASHLLYTQVLHDADPNQRKQGMNAGFEWGRRAHKVVAYTDYGISPGMQEAMKIYGRHEIPIEYRKIGKNMAEPVSIVVFKWNKEGYRTQFDSEAVNKFFRMIDRHVTVPHRKICITDDQRGIDDHIETIHLWDNPCPRYGNENKPNCFYRLKMFSPEIEKLVGPRFIWMDLDAVIVDNIDDIITDPAEFKMWRVDDEYMPCNGSLTMHKVGTRVSVWKEFNPNQVHPVTGLRVAGYIGSDQAHIANNLRLKDVPDEECFMKKDGIWSFRCHLKKKNITDLPKGAKIIFFHGVSSPWDPGLADQFPWIKEHYVDV